jgi:hypothetical protein
MSDKVQFEVPPTRLNGDGVPSQQLTDTVVAQETGLSLFER